MSFLKETPKSLSIYFVVVGIFGLLSDIGLYADSGKHLSPLAQAIVISDIVVCLVFMYVGKNLREMLREQSHIPVGILVVNLAVIGVSGLLSVSAFGKLIVAAGLTFYLYTNVKRMMTFVEDLK